LDALAVTGFDIEKSEPLYVQGFRPRKVGLFVGSGGETVGVWMNPISPDSTGVRVATQKSIAGIVGQKNWTAEVLEQMKKEISE